MAYTFMDTSITMLHLMAREIRADIISKEPRVQDVEVEMDPKIKNGCLIVKISYQIVEDNTRDNLLFPFYLDITIQEEG